MMRDLKSVSLVAIPWQPFATKNYNAVRYGISFARGNTLAIIYTKEIKLCMIQNKFPARQYPGNRLRPRNTMMHDFRSVSCVAIP